MGARISESLRSEVKQRWIKGESRNKIAAICGISQGAVSGIIDEWKRSVGVSLADQQRDLFTAMNRQGISVVECAQGFRIAKILKNIGVEADREESFLVETYNICIAIGFRPEDIAAHLSDLISFATDCKNLGIGIERKSEGGNDDNDDDKGGTGDRHAPHPIPTILQIEKYLENVKQEIKESELKNKELKKETELQELKQSSIMQETAAMLNKNRVTAEKLDWYLDLKTELLAAGHSENDFELVLKAISLIKENGYDLLAIAAQFSEHEQLKSSVRRLQVQNSISESKGRQLEEKATNIEQAIESKSQLLWHMVELETMGLGLKQIKRLYNVIKELNEANGFSEADGYAVKIFLDQVERNYDNLLGFEKRKDDLMAEINNLRIQHLGQVNIISALPYVGGALARLLNKGLQEDQIVKIANLSEMHPEIIQPFLQDNNKGGGEGQQRKDDFKSISSLSSSPFSSFSPPLSTSSSPSQPQQPPFPQTSTGQTVQKSSSRPPTELHSTSPTSKPSVDNVTSDKESDIQSFAPSLSLEQPPAKVHHKNNSPGVAAIAPKQGASTHKYKSSQPADMRLKKDNQDQDQINPTLAWTPTFLEMEIKIPKSIHLGTGQVSLLDTLVETVYQSNQRNYRARDGTTHFPNENTSTLKTTLPDAFGNSVLPAHESSQAVEDSIRNQAFRSPGANSDQIETLPVASITASSTSDPANLPLNVLDGNFETSWTNKGIKSWLSLDLGTLKNIQSVAIAWYLGDSFDYYYSISLSNDGIIFTKVNTGCSGGNSRSFQQCILKLCIWRDMSKLQ
ncbi:MAG: discoidin domain-containing protein [Nitrososphaeraceae archaeon]